jgi:hypothetical protein
MTEEEREEETGWKLVHGDVFRPPVCDSVCVCVCVRVCVCVCVHVCVHLLSVLIPSALAYAPRTLYVCSEAALTNSANPTE